MNGKQNDLKIIYCRGGDKTAPAIAKYSGMKYGLRYNYTAYSKDVYMVDAGLSPKWTTYIKRLRQLRPKFALTPDYISFDPIQLQLRYMDVIQYASRVGVCPKFSGAIYDIPDDAVICESIPSSYAGWLIPDNEIIPNRDYHLLGGDPVLQKQEINRINSLGGRVVSVDGNKIAMKAAHGQIFIAGRWVGTNDTTFNNAKISAKNVVKYLLS